MPTTSLTDISVIGIDIGKNSFHIVGRWTASAIASASRKSFFCPFEYGRTYFAGINRAS